MPIKTPTRFVGQAEVVSELHHRCPGDHQHHQFEGTVKTSAYGRISLSSWAGGYPLPLCRAIMRGVHTFLDKRANDTRTEVYMLEDQVPEEAIQEGEEGIDEEEQRIQSYKDESEDDLEEEERRPICQEVKRAVEFAHRQLGHPSRDTLVRMLRISGAIQMMQSGTLADGIAMYAGCSSRQSIRSPQPLLQDHLLSIEFCTLTSNISSTPKVGSIPV